MKYIRTYHLPNSEGISDDDEVLKSIQSFIGKDVVYSEKLDGECTALLTYDIHARSEESTHYPWQSWIRSLHGQMGWKIPENLQIFGENMYAKHSIYYDKLTSFFYVFAIIDLRRNVFLSVDSVLEICDSLGIQHVPILRRGSFDPGFKVLVKSAFGDEVEGYVVRVADEFPVDNANTNIAKWVRKDHVKTDEHWKRRWSPNKLGS